VPLSLIRNEWDDADRGSASAERQKVLQIAGRRNYGGSSDILGLWADFQ
jgi:hypothetical protein